MKKLELPSNIMYESTLTFSSCCLKFLSIQLEKVSRDTESTSMSCFCRLPQTYGARESIIGSDLSENNVSSIKAYCLAFFLYVAMFTTFNVKKEFIHENIAKHFSP